MADNGTTTATDRMHGQAASLKDQVKDLVGAGQEKVHEVKDKIMDAKDMVQDRAEGVMKSLTGSIKKHPLASVGIAFGIGYVAMRIFR